MASPVVESVGTYQSSASGTSHDLTLPTGVTTGDLLLAFVSCDGRRTFTMTGWTTLFSDTDNVGGSGTGGNSLHIAYRVSDGSDPVTVGLSSTEDLNGIIYRVSGHEAPGTQAPEVTTNVASGNTPGTTSDPPSLSPTGGSKDYLWVTGVGVDDQDITDAPTNYTTNATIINTVGTGEAPLGVSHRAATAASEDPGAWGTWASDTHIGFTLAVHPGASGATLERSVAASAVSATAVAGTFWTTFTRAVAASATGAIVVAAFLRHLLRSTSASATSAATLSGFLRHLLRSTAATAASGVATAGTFWTTFERAVAATAASGVATVGEIIVLIERAVAATAASSVEVAGFLRILLRQVASSATSLTAVSGLKTAIRQVAASAASGVATTGARTLTRAVALAGVTAASVSGLLTHVRAVAASAVSLIQTSYIRELLRQAASSAVSGVSTTYTIITDRLQELPKIRKLQRRNR